MKLPLTDLGYGSTTCSEVSDGNESHEESFEFASDGFLTVASPALREHVISRLEAVERQEASWASLCHLLTGHGPGWCLSGSELRALSARVSVCRRA